MSEDESAWQLLLVVPEEKGGGTKFGNIRAAAKQRQRAMEKKMDHLFAVNQKVSEALRSRKTYAEVRDMIKNSKVVLETHEAKPNDDELGMLAPTKDINTSYRDQGNLDMYTSANMKAREQNKYNPEVKAAIESFWESLPKSQNGNVNKAIYKWYSRKLFYALVPKATEEEFQRVVEEDWKNDAVWTCTMNSRMFRNAVFQLADIWCETTDPLEYRDFVLKCRDIVAVPPAFTGNREESESTGTNRRATIRDTGRRRGSSVASMAGTPIDTPLQPVQERFSDVEEELAALENIDNEIFETEAGAWNNMLKEFSEYQAQDREDDEEDLLRALHIIQDERFDLLNDDTDRSFGIEKMFMDEIREAYDYRCQQRDKIDAAASFPAIKKGTPAAERTRNRLQLQARRRGAEDSMYSSIQNSMLKGIVRSREYRNTLLDLQKDTINQRLLKLARDPNVVFFAGLRLQDQERRHEMEADLLDESFTFYAAMCKELKDTRDLLQKRINDPLGTDIYPNTRTGDHEALKFSSKKWPKAVDWLERLQNRRDEFYSDSLEAMKEHLTKVQFKGKQHLMSLHRQQMGAETKQIDLIANDTTVGHEQKMADLHAAQQVKRDETVRRTRELAEFDALIAELSTKIEALGTSGQERCTAERRQLTKFRKTTTLEDAFEAAKPVFSIYMDDMSEAAMEETMSINAAIFNPALALQLPSDVESASDFLLYVIDKADEWWSVVIGKIAAMRHEILLQFEGWLTARDAEEQIRIVQQQSQASKKRVAQVQEYKAVLKDEGERSKLASDVREVIDERLKLSSVYHELEDEAEELTNAAQSEIERFKQLHLARSAEQRARIKKVYELERVTRERFGDLESLRYRRLESCWQRSLWLVSDADTPKPRERTESLNNSLQMEDENLERKRLEAERMRRVREKQELERRAMEEARIKRLEEAEKERKEMALRKDADAKRRVELRKKQLVEREKLQQERMRQERERRKEYASQLKENKHARKTQQSKRFRTHQDIAEEKAKQATTPTAKGDDDDKKKKAGSTTTLRRKTKVYNSNVDAKKATAAQKKVISSSSPKSRVHQAIQEEINMFQNLNTQSMQVNLEDFNHRRIDYFIEELSNVGIYQAECRRQECTPLPAVERYLTTESLSFQMNRLQVNDMKFDVLTLLDVVRMNPIQTLVLNNVKMDKDQCKKLCQALLTHPFISYLEVCDNSDLGPHGGQALLSLAQSATQISKISCQRCGIPPETVAAIANQTGKNAFDKTIGRTEFEFIHSIFKELDLDGNGTICIDELKDYNDRNSALQGSRSTANLRRTRNATSLTESGNSDAASETMNKINDTMSLRLDQVRDVLLSMETKGLTKDAFDLADLITFIYPSWNRSRAEALITKYLDDSAAGPNLRELQEFMDAFGSAEGFLTLEQLATGLGEEDAEALRPAFVEADLDQDNLLSLEEFMRFVSA